MTTSGKRKCYYSLLITLFLLGIYWLGNSINLPSINSSYLSSMSQFYEREVKVSIFALGFAPFLTGFVVVEIFSLIVPAGRRLRSGGARGRATLNRAAMAASILLCIFQSFMVAIAMERTGSPNGLLLVSNPGWLFRLVTCVTLTAGSFSIFFIARLISWRGIANGFCVLIALDTLAPFIKQLELGLDSFRGVRSAYPMGWLGFMAAVLLALFIYYKRMASTSVGIVESQGRAKLDIPIFPQGVLPLLWAFNVFNLYSVIRHFPGFGSIAHPVGFLPFLLGTTILIVVFSIVGVVMFSNRKRIAHNLPTGVRVDDSFDGLLRAQAIRGAAVLALGSAVFLILERRFEWPFIPDYASLILIVAIALDVTQQWRFYWNHDKPAVLIELDNPHLASYLKNLLELNGINAVVQTFHYRRLLFFFGPLTKMRILVETEDSEKAQGLIDWKSIQIQ
jgi:preprotein translocase subunit SecY